MTLKTGDLAYFDSFAGMVPCKVLSIGGISGLASSAQAVTLVVTATRGAYQKGEVLETSGLHAVPRCAHYYGPCGIGRIRAYTVEVGMVTK